MQLIPVIDIMKGQVVRAVRGERHNYKPIESRLVAGSRPLDVARALCSHCRSTQLYLADLDALQGGEAQLAALRELLQGMPELQLWLDAGFGSATAVDALLAALGDAASRVLPVVGSESLATREAFEGCFAPGRRAVLSLDRRGGERLDAAGCWELPALWPPQVIVMTLERVGADAGPDLDTLRQVQSRAPRTQLIGAGGVRHEADLQAAAAAGASAWLVASALHNGALPARH